MSRVLSQGEIEGLLGENLVRLERETGFYAELLEREALSEAKFKRKRAAVFLRGAGSVRDKECFADTECSGEHEVWLLDAARVKAQREVLRMLVENQQSLRSLNANVRGQV